MIHERVGGATEQVRWRQRLTSKHRVSGHQHRGGRVRNVGGSQVAIRTRRWPIRSSVALLHNCGRRKTIIKDDLIHMYTLEIRLRNIRSSDT